MRYTKKKKIKSSLRKLAVYEDKFAETHIQITTATKKKIVNKGIDAITKPINNTQYIT